MNVTVLIPAPLRQFTAKQDAITCSGETVATVLQEIYDKFPQIKRHLFSEDGKLRDYVNVYVNTDDIRYLNVLLTPVKEGDTISIIPSIAGG